MRSARVVVEVNIRGATENKPTSQGRVSFLFTSCKGDKLPRQINLLVEGGAELECTDKNQVPVARGRGDGSAESLCTKPTIYSFSGEFR